MNIGLSSWFTWVSLALLGVRVFELESKVKLNNNAISLIRGVMKVHQLSKSILSDED
jgi:hypothetical protein